MLESQSIGDIGIDFETFKGFFENDIAMSKTVDKLFKKKFGKQYLEMRCLLDSVVQRMTIEMSQMGVEIDDIILRFIYEKIKETPVTKIDKILGHGAEACVFDLGDKIIKCYYKNTIPAPTRKFFELCLKGEHKIFPKVYRIGKGYVVMEKVTPCTKKVQRMFATLSKKVKHNGVESTLYHIIQDKTYKYDELTNFQKEIVDFMEEIRQVLGDLSGNGINLYGDFGDFHKDNVGEKEDGTIVYFDV